MKENAHKIVNITHNLVNALVYQGIHGIVPRQHALRLQVANKTKFSRVEVVSAFKIITKLMENANNVQIIVIMIHQGASAPATLAISFKETYVPKCVLLIKLMSMEFVNANQTTGKIPLETVNINKIVMIMK